MGDLVPGNKTVSETIKGLKVSGKIIKQSWYLPDYSGRLRVSAKGAVIFWKKTMREIQRKRSGHECRLDIINIIN